MNTERNSLNPVPAIPPKLPELPGIMVRESYTDRTFTAQIDDSIEASAMLLGLARLIPVRARLHGPIELTFHTPRDIPHDRP